MFIDVKIKTLSIRHRVFTEEAIQALLDVCKSLAREINARTPKNPIESLYEIRVKDETYSGPSSEEFETHYRSGEVATSIKIVLQQNSATIADKLEFRVSISLVQNQESTLEVLGLDPTNTNGLFTRFSAAIERAPRRNRLVYHPIFELLVQLTAVLVITTGSVAATSQIASSINVQYSHVYVFLVIFLLLSNIWTYLGQGLRFARTRLYPIVDIRKKPRAAILLPAMGFVFTTIAGWTIKFILDLLGSRL